MESSSKYSQIWNFTRLKFSIPEFFKESSDGIKSIESVKQKLTTEVDLEGSSNQYLLNLGLFCLQEFVRVNFIGPRGASPQLEKFLSSITKDEILLELAIDGSQCSKNVEAPLLIAIAKWIFVDKSIIDWDNIGSDLSILGWWGGRVILIWQWMLLEPSETLKENFEKLMTNFIAEKQSDDWMRNELELLFWLETGMGYFNFYDHSRAENALKKIEELSGITLELTGAMGKRTKFQQKEVAQLKLSVKSDINDFRHSFPEIDGFGDGEKGAENGFMPKNCLLNDDTVMEKVKFTNGADECSMEKIGPLEQAVVLLKTKFEWRMLPKMGDLLHEEIKTFLDKILENPLDPAVQSSALFLRCEVEKTERRRVERALAQTEQLTKEFEDHSSDKSSPFFFCAGIVPIWRIRKLQADILITLGISSEALGIYQSLECWPEVVECYKSLGKLDYAEHIVRDRLKEKEDPIFLCLLGDITSNPEHYERAWEVSGNRSSLAMASLGRLLMHKKQNERAFDCFKKSLEIRPIQQRTWFNLGCCSMELKRYDEAASAFHRCLNIEPDNFEAWNNLAAAYMHSRKLDKAYRTLQETLRYNYENWKVWDNYMGVSMQLGNFKEAVRSYHRLLDLRMKHTDILVLSTLVSGTKFTLESGDNSLVTDLRRLFGRLTSVVTSDPGIWRQYARLIEPYAAEDSEEEWDKYVKTLQRAHQCGFQTANWEKNEDTCVNVLRTADKLIQAQLRQCNFDSVSEERVVQVKSSVRMTLKGVLARVKKYYENSDITNEQIKTLCDELQSVSND